MAIIRYPADAPADTPFVFFKFKSLQDVGQKGEIALFMPPAFQISDGQNYEFTSKGLASKIITAGTDMFQQGLFASVGAAGNAALGMVGLAEEAAANSGSAVRDPKFFTYKDPKPREFTFNYKFEPKNETDAKNMLAIIDTFRIASYPYLLSMKLYGAPDTVNVSFSNIQGLDNIDSLVIKDINTTISEGEQVVTFLDGIPTQISLQITFAEPIMRTKETKTGKFGKNQGIG
jgi:hypothetical protein